jgi:hypothetical protein
VRRLAAGIANGQIKLDDAQGTTPFHVFAAFLRKRRVADLDEQEQEQQQHCPSRSADAVDAKKQRVTDEELALLDGCGFKWTDALPDTFEDGYEMLVKYIELYHTANVPRSYTSTAFTGLGMWLETQLQLMSTALKFRLLCQQSQQQSQQHSQQHSKQSHNELLMVNEYGPTITSAQETKLFQLGHAPPGLVLAL